MALYRVWRHESNKDVVITQAGWSMWAFWLTCLWAFNYGMWLVGAVIIFAIGVLKGFVGFAHDVLLWFVFMIMLACGLGGNALLESYLRRKHYQLIEEVDAPDKRLVAEKYRKLGFVNTR